MDVGGTFTKAIAFDLNLGTIVAEAIVPTTHDAVEGVAAGVVQCVAEVAATVGADNIDLVTHSTTQAVNALLEGDVGTVGVIGLGRIPELKRARARTQLSEVELSPGKFLKTVPVFFDVTAGLDEVAVNEALASMRRQGVTTICVAEAFAPDDATNETRVAELATEQGMVACASTELSGLYGLELRAVTAAINASILPIAVRTAGFVADGVRAAGIHAPVMVMRGDGGATDLAGFQKAPAKTLYSGPAASVAGALRYADVADAVVVEVGGTSTNVAAVRFGRPALSYVQVASHATAVRAVDVRVVGVAGGSMLRLRTGRNTGAALRRFASVLARPPHSFQSHSGRRGARHVGGVGPRSAHIAGYPYACFVAAPLIEGAVLELVAPRPGDAADYAVLRLRDGSAVAITNTCAAVVLGVPHPSDYCYVDPAAANAAFAVLGAELGITGHVIAQQMLQASGETVAELIHSLIKSQKLRAPQIVAVGGGAGGLGRYVASMLGLECTVPEGAAVISSIGDALSLVRVERERTVDSLDGDMARRLLAEVEAEAVAAGASPGSLEVRLEERPESGTVRAIATGAVGLLAGAIPGRYPALLTDITSCAAQGATVVESGQYWLVVSGSHVDVLDRFGDPSAAMVGEVVEPDGLADAALRHTRYRGPVTLRPSVWVIDGSRLLELSSGDVVASATAMIDTSRPQTFIVGRPA